jgi:hypothetical protein
MLIRKWVFVFGVAVTLLFIILSAYCMVIYPGGTVTNYHTEGYSFFTNYFSDLGRTHNFLQQSNLNSMIVFRTSVTLIGIATILFFLTIPFFFLTSILTRNLSLIGSLTGIITGFGYIGIAFTPVDIMYPFHMFMVKVAFNSFLITVVLYAIAIFKNPVYPNLYSWAYLIFGIILALYILINLFGPGSKTPQGLAIRVTTQKIVVYAQIMCMMVQAYGAWMLNKNLGKDIGLLKPSS